MFTHDILVINTHPWFCLVSLHVIKPVANDVYM